MRLPSSFVLAMGLQTTLFLLLTFQMTQAHSAFVPSSTEATTTTAFAAASPRSAPNTAIQPGDKLPPSDVFWGFPNPQKVNMASYCGGRNVIIVGLPAAFTPASSNVHVPSYITDSVRSTLEDELGVEEVIFYSVVDSAVMGVYMAKLNLGGTMVQMFGDPSGEFTSACGMELIDEYPAVELGLRNRSKRFAMHVVNNIVQYVAVSEAEGDPMGDLNLESTCAPALIEAIRKTKQTTVVGAVGAGIESSIDKNKTKSRVSK